MKFENMTLEQVAAKLGIGHYHRHVLLCAGPDCCSPEVGNAAWDALMRELKDRGLSLSTGPNACYRTKANCLRVCQGVGRSPSFTLRARGTTG